MKVNEQWLREWVNPKIETDKLAHELTMAGLEVDALEPVCDSTLENVVVGQVTQIDPHPDADKLQICTVNVGEGNALSIVCGAANVAVNGKYPVAKIGAKLSGGLTIKPAKLRGVASEGMLCSTQELGLSDSASGLFTLPTDANIGDSIYDYLSLNDTTIDIGLTPNRGDCLSVVGVAREVSVLLKTEYKPITIPTIKPTGKDKISVKLQADKACARYVGRIIQGIDVSAKTPLWMKEKLRRCGLRSISPIVDVTNYVLLELGQPMHAFDFSKLDGGIVVRYAQDKEKLTLLDGQEIELSNDSLVIADHKKAVALAGIMGGADTAVTDETKDILLESAYFDPISIAGKARFYGLHTDSSHRFERGVDFTLQQKAIERATQLIIEIAGGEACPVVEQTAKKNLPSRNPITFRYQRIERTLGITVPKPRVAEILTALSFELVENKAGWQVTPPSFRFDVELEVDLIEEIARIYGYNNIPETNPQFEAKLSLRSESVVDDNEIRSLMVGRGYQEIITYSFVDPKLQQLINTDVEAVSLQNPISADMSEMRTSLWPGLLQAALYNQNRQQDRLQLFEMGLSFQQKAGDIEQKSSIAGLIMGNIRPEQWGEDNQKRDFFDAKSDVEALIGLTRQSEQFEFVTETHSILHPGQSATVNSTSINGTQFLVGRLGTLHPSVQQKLGFNERVMLFELHLDEIKKQRIPIFKELSKFPAIRRDLAVVVDEKVTMSRIGECVKNSAPKMLKNLQLFDEYRGKGIDSGRKSLAFGLTLQNQDRTLTDTEVDTIVARIVDSLNTELGATLRE